MTKPFRSHIRLCACEQHRYMWRKFNACWYCRWAAANWKSPAKRVTSLDTRKPLPPAPRHVSQSVYLRHDPIAARYQWAQAVTR